MSIYFCICGLQIAPDGVTHFLAKSDLTSEMLNYEWFETLVKNCLDEWERENQGSGI